MIPRSVCTALLVLLAGAAARADHDGGAVSRQKRFIRELFAAGRYFDAAEETKRLRSREKTGVDRGDCDLFIDVNYFLGGQYRSVAKNMADRPGTPDPRSSILLSQSYLRLGMCGRALGALDGVGYGTVAGPQRYRLLARKAEAYAACGLYRELRAEIDRAAPFVPERELVALLRTGTERHETMPRISVPLAVALSALVPGAGQMYAGKHISGVVSFLGVAAMAGGAVLFYRGGRRELSFTFIFLSSLLHVGNIYGAFNAARAANEDRERGFRESLARTCIPPYDPEAEARDTGVFR